MKCFAALVIGAAAAAAVDGPSKADYCSRFVPCTDSCSTLLRNWIGQYVDLFSPDDVCPDSRRYIEWYHMDNLLHVSANGTDEHCNSSWGRKFHPDGQVDPIVNADHGRACTALVSFESKVPKDAPVRPFVDKGALDFTIQLGTIPPHRDGRDESPKGRKVIMFSGMYRGKGGPWLAPNGTEITVPSAGCDNFWA